jgi:SAM-dependent methyltransferase
MDEAQPNATDPLDTLLRDAREHDRRPVGRLARSLAGAVPRSEVLEPLVGALKNGQLRDAGLEASLRQAHAGLQHAIGRFEEHIAKLQRDVAALNEGLRELTARTVRLELSEAHLQSALNDTNMRTSSQASQLEALEAGLSGVFVQVDEMRTESAARNTATASTLATLGQKIEELDRHLSDQGPRLGQIAAEIAKLSDRIESSRAECEARLRRLPEIVEHHWLEQWQRAGAGASPVALAQLAEAAMRQARDVAAALAASKQESTQRSDRLASELGELTAVLRAGDFRHSELHERMGQMERVVDELRRAIDAQENHRRTQNGAADASASSAAKAAQAGLDAFYVDFENRFRGSREEVTEKQRHYLPYLHRALAMGGPGPVLDLGCGRGEWLELLQTEGITAHGVDLNRQMVVIARKRGLDVSHGDGIAALRAAPESSLAGLTLFHLVEHLPYPAVLDLLAEAGRVLRPGGVLIIETPNPQNLIVGACNFYMDPSHRNPIPPMTLEFMVEHAGFVGREVLHLQPFPSHQRFPGVDTPLARALDEFFHGPRDYAIVAYRPPVPTPLV